MERLKTLIAGSVFAAMYKAVQQSCRCLANGEIDPFIDKGGTAKAMEEAQATTGLDRLLAIEKRTMSD